MDVVFSELVRRELEYGVCENDTEDVRLLEFRSAVVEFGSAVVEFRSAVVEFGSAVMEFRSAVVEFGSAVMEFRSAVVEFGSAVVEFGSAVMEFGSAVVEFGSAIVGKETKLLEEVTSGPLVEYIFEEIKVYLECDIVGIVKLASMLV